MRVYGNLMNRIAETVRPPEPEVGMGATILMFSDRHAATVVSLLTRSRIAVRTDIATRTDSRGMSDEQDYRYEPNPKAAIEIFTKRKNGTWVKQGDSMKSGTILRLGVRDEHYDFGF